MAPKAHLLHGKVLYTGRVIQLRKDTLIEPGGVQATRELVCHPGSVVILPVLDDGQVILVRQYRHAAGKLLWELVAGSLEPGETPQHAARRELLEETGYRARHLRPVFTFYPSPGFLSERMYLFEARSLTHEKAHPEEDERIEVRAFPFSNLRSMIARKTLQDGKTLIGLLWHLQRA